MCISRKPIFSGGYLVFWGAYRNTGNLNDSNTIGAEFKTGDERNRRLGCLYVYARRSDPHSTTTKRRLSKDMKDEWKYTSTHHIRSLCI